METVSGIVVSLAQILPPKKPLVPVLVKDQNIGLLILTSLTFISIFALYKIMRHYDG